MLRAYKHVDQCELIRDHVLRAYKPVDQCELIREHVLRAYKPELTSVG